MRIGVRRYRSKKGRYSGQDGAAGEINETGGGGGGGGGKERGDVQCRKRQMEIKRGGDE